MSNTNKISFQTKHSNSQWGPPLSSVAPRMIKRRKLSNIFTVVPHFIPENAPRKPDPLQTAAPAECSFRAGWTWIYCSFRGKRPWKSTCGDTVWWGRRRRRRPFQSLLDCCFVWSARQCFVSPGPRLHDVFFLFAGCLMCFLSPAREEKEARAQRMVRRVRSAKIANSD